MYEVQQRKENGRGHCSLEELEKAVERRENLSWFLEIDDIFLWMETPDVSESKM